jgi:hypothetical protein
MNTPPSAIEIARQRLEVLHHDCTERDRRDLDLAEQAALRTVLDELHRLNVAVSIQREIIARMKNQTTSRNRQAPAPKQVHRAGGKRSHREGGK